MRFTTSELLPVSAPYRLDLTVDALRRLASNAVDTVGDDGAFYRVLSIDGEATIVRVTQVDETTLDVQASGSSAVRAAPIVRRMLGTDVDLDAWYRRSATIPWLARIARECRGVKPPRYPTLWEACAHAIVFQQISIHAASAIMGRVVSALGSAFEVAGTTIRAFPPPEAVLAADDETLRVAGLSANKRAHLRSVATAIVAGDLDGEALEAMPSEEAAKRLVGVRGLGPWSASVVLLRGFGRMDAFPMRDSGVARTIKRLSGDPEVSIEAVLDTLGPTRGMLYFHLLLGKLKNL